MKREEAIKELNTFKKLAKSESGEKALDMAIKALEQEPCEDAISRQAVLDLIEHYNSDGLGSVFFGYKQGVKFADAVNKLPSVKPQYTDAEIQKMQEMEQAEIEKAYELGKTSHPKIGHWIEKDTTYYEELNKRGLGVDEYTPYFTDDIACSECLAKYSTIDNETQFFKYCPNCGCRMESEDKE